MAQFDIVPGLTYADRSAWKPNHPRLGDKVARDRRTHVIIHHTVMPDKDAGNINNVWEDEDEVFGMMQSLEVARASDLGKDVPYSFVCFLMKAATPKMMVCEGRGEDRTGAHTKGHNTKGIGVAFAGDFHNLDADVGKYIPLLSFFLGWLKFDPNHPSYGGPYAPMSNLGSLSPSGRKVFAHRDFKATACPGEEIRPFLRQIDFSDPR